MNKETVSRIIIDTPQQAAFNMAADLYMMEQCAVKNEVTVRFYKWSPPAITIGYSQKASDLLDLDRLHSEGVRWIRRPTGGRAVLHYEDITYSVIFPRTLKSMGSSIAESYRVISNCLITGLRMAGIDCIAHDSFDDLKQVRREVKLPCFLAPNREEIMIQGKKLVGSAQKRTSGAVLQHGSIPFTNAYRKLPDFQMISEPERSGHKKLLVSKSTCIREISPDLDEQFLITCLIKGFAQELPFPARRMPWASNELKSIDMLAQSTRFKTHWMSDSPDNDD